jgi:hypothetical protein
LGLTLIAASQLKTQAVGGLAIGAILVGVGNRVADILTLFSFFFTLTCFESGHTCCAWKSVAPIMRSKKTLLIILGWHCCSAVSSYSDLPGKARYSRYSGRAANVEGSWFEIAIDAPLLVRGHLGNPWRLILGTLDARAKAKP